jgi:very-short-patch-repair endonuclease
LGVIGQGASKEKRALAREHRKSPTPAEALFWEHVRAKRLDGLTFRRQQVVHGFIADFACDALKLIVELDGSVHAAQRDSDADRDRVLGSMGFRVLRFSNDEVLNDIGLVLRKIRKNEPARVPTPPLPVRGGAGGEDD